MLRSWGAIRIPPPRTCLPQINRRFADVMRRRFASSAGGPVKNSSYLDMSLRQLFRVREPGAKALLSLDYIGTAVFAASGTLLAGECGMDTLGCTLVGTITAVGGGTLRDILLGRLPVFWFMRTSYLATCVATSLCTFFLDDVLERAGLLHENFLYWGDTIGLGAFAVVGAQTALASGMGIFVSGLCGMFTATMGGLIRDVLCKKNPSLLYSPSPDAPADKGTVYAPTALAGAFAYSFVTRYGSRVGLRNPNWGIWLGFATTVFLRYMGSQHVVRLKPMQRFSASQLSAPQPYLKPGDEHIIMTAYGSDSLGLVRKVSSIIADHSGSISASKIITIGADIAFMVMVSVPQVGAGGLRAALEKQGELLNLQINSHTVKLSKPQPEKLNEEDARSRFKAKIKLIGPDSHGIVSKVSDMLALHGLNIYSMDSRVYGAEQEDVAARARSPAERAETDIFSLTAVVASDHMPSVHILDRDIKKLNLELGVQLTIDWM